MARRFNTPPSLGELLEIEDIIVVDRLGSPFEPGGQPVAPLFETQGTQGPQGFQGAQGAQGQDGTGSQGSQGGQGRQGSQGSTGAQGAQGLQGVAGPQGLQGSIGAQGATGSGLQGSQGRQGDVGTQGSQGTLGAQGSQGVQGTTGTQGSQGFQGRQGDVGSQGLQGNQGPGAPDFTDTFQATTSTPTVIRNLALTDNAITRVTVFAAARTSTTSWYKKKSSTEWTRSNGGAAIQLGTDDGPPAVDNIGIAGASVAANANGIDFIFAGSGTVHVRGELEIFIDIIPLAVPT